MGDGLSRSRCCCAATAERRAACADCCSLLFGEEEKNCVNRFDLAVDGLRLLSVDGVATVVVVELAKGFLGSLLDIVVMNLSKLIVLFVIYRVAKQPTRVVVRGL